MKTPPQISVVIPLYNAEKQIAKTVQSVLDQTYPHFELIILNDRSTDASVHLIEQFDDPRIRIITHTTRLGFLGNWNACLQAMRAPYGKLLPHDDTLDPTCLEKQYALLEAHPEVSFVHCSRRIIDTQDNVLLTRSPREKEGIYTLPVTLRNVVRSGTNPIGEPAAVLFRTAAIEEVGSFSDTRIYSIDIDYWIRLLDIGDRYAQPEPLCTFRVWPQSTSVKMSRKQARCMIVFFNELLDRYPQYLSYADLCMGALKAHLNQVARTCFYAGLRVKNRLTQRL